MLSGHPQEKTLKFFETPGTSRPRRSIISEKTGVCTSIADRTKNLAQSEDYGLCYDCDHNRNPEQLPTSAPVGKPKGTLHLRIKRLR
jgi:hypothetical protein